MCTTELSWNWKDCSDRFVGRKQFQSCVQYIVEAEAEEDRRTKQQSNIPPDTIVCTSIGGRFLSATATLSVVQHTNAVIMLFIVTVPNTAQPGETIRVRCPQQNETNLPNSTIEVVVEIPKGLRPGDSFVFDLPPETSPTALASKSTSKGGAIEGIRGKFEDLARQHEELILAIGVGYVMILTAPAGGALPVPGVQNT